MLRTEGHCVPTNLYIPEELVVAIEVDSLKLPHLVELELEFHRLAVSRVVSPTDPTLACNTSTSHMERLLCVCSDTDTKNYFRL